MKKLLLVTLLALSMSATTEPTATMGSKCYGWAPRCSFGQELVCLCDSYGFDCRFVCIDKY